MLQIFQEAELPKLSQTSLFIKFNQSSGITKCISDELKKVKSTCVKPDDIPEIISLIKLNGTAMAKRAVACYQKGNIVIINNKETSKIPQSLPFIIAVQNGKPTAFVFADKVVNNINSSQEYTSLMAVLEAAYLALCLYLKPKSFTMNRQLVLNLCIIYTLMVISPLEQRLYMKGENLTKAMLYASTYFYKMIDGDAITENSIPYKRFIDDKIDPSVIKQVVSEVKGMKDMSFMNLLKLISNINPVRYKDMPVMYLKYFVTSCGTSLIFALENPSYLFLLITSSNYKTRITAMGINKTIGLRAKKVNALLSSMNF